MLSLTLYLEIVYHLWLGRYGSRSTDELVGESGSQFPALIRKLSLPHRSRFVPGVPTQNIWTKSTTKVSSATSTPTRNGFGLQVLHDPSLVIGPPTSCAFNLVDIVFVHGLGGAAHRTWTHARSNEAWPSWLPREDGLKNVRISTFGYDANFKNILAPSNALGISDFAKQLLDVLDLHYDKYGNVLLS